KAKPETVDETRYSNMTAGQALENADSYAQFARTLFNIGSMKAERAKETATEGGEVKRKAIGSEEPAAVSSNVHEVLHSPGEPLDSATRDWMAPRFGQDFNDVKVHTNRRAAESAEEVKAAAYTVGQDVVFGAGRYEPQTAAGRELLAHELTHVVQQRRSNDSSNSNL